MAASGRKAWEARSTRGKLLRRVAGVAILGALAVTVPVIASGNPLMRSQDTTQMASDPEVVYINSVSDSGQRVVNFNDNWKFIMEDLTGAEAGGYNDSSWETINLPHDYSIDQEYTATGEAESGYKLGGIGWYRKTFDVSKELKGKTVRLDFDGVYMNATVYVNGENLGTHPYGYSPFSFDITDYLRYGEQNTIAVRVNHQTPSSRWYSGSGIGRDVDLVITDAVHVEKDGVVVTTPDLATGSAKTDLKTTIKNDTKSEVQVEVVQTILDADGAEVGGPVTTKETVAVNSSETFTASTTPTIAADNYWSVESPTLYTAHTEVKVGDKVVDTYDVTFGYRYFNFDADNGFSLNGQALKLKGVCMHHDQGSLGSVNYYDALERQVVMLKEMGCNAIRITHNPAARELIEICNKHGMLLIEEFFDGWSAAKNGNTYDYARFFAQEIGESELMNSSEDMTWAEFDLKETLRRDINSPAIIMWSLGNEVTEGAPGENVPNYNQHQQNLIKWTKDLDTTRPVTQGDNKWKGNGDGTARQNPAAIAAAGGIVGSNYTNGQQYDNAHNTGWKLYGSETASAVNSRGVYNVTGSQQLNSDKLLTSYDKSAVGWGATASSAWYDVITRDFIAGEFVWTGFDYLGEPTPKNGTGAGWAEDTNETNAPKNSFFGIIDTAGLPKDSYYLYQALWNDDVHTLHVLPAWTNDTSVVAQNNGNIEVVVYTDAPGAKLVLEKADGTQKDVDTAKFFKTERTDAGFTYQIDKKNASSHEGLYFTWNIPYEEGTLKAVPLDEDGTEITDSYDWQGRTSISTPGRATRLEAEVTNNYDREGLSANGTDLAYITVSVLDENGQVVPDATNKITFEVSGAGELAGIDNGVQSDHQSFRDNNRKAQAGQLVGIVRAGKTAGTITVTVKADGLTEDTIEIPVAASQESGEEKTVSSVLFSQFYYVKTGGSVTLPDTVTVNYSNGEQDTAAKVEWGSLTEEQLSTPGTYQVSGTVAGAKITANVTVLDGVAALLNYSTTVSVGSNPILPSSRPAVMADGEVLNASFPVTWDDAAEGAYDKAGTVNLTGHATVFGKSIELTATVRVQEQTYTLTGNVAPSAAEVTQSVPENMQSDTLKAVNDGKQALDANSGGASNTSCWSNWKYSNQGKVNTASLTFRYDTQQVLGQAVIYFGQDSGSGRLPKEVKFEVSETGAEDSWTEVITQETSESTTGLGKVTKNTYDFQPTAATFVRITVTNADKTSGMTQEPCTMITEIELYTTEGSTTVNSTANLDTLTVNGTDLSEDELAAESYSTPAVVANITNAAGADNAAVTVLPQDGDAVKIIIESEDHATRKTFTINLNTKPPVAADDDSLDYPVNQMTVSAGSEQPKESEGPVELAFDGKPNTHYHSNWDSIPDFNNLWVEMVLEEPTAIDGLRYLPRQSGGSNGALTEYVVQYWDEESEAWVNAVQKTAQSSDKSWQYAGFEEPITAQKFRLKAVHTYGDSGNDKFMSAAEIRLRMAAETVDISGATVEYPNTLEVNRVNDEHPATFSPDAVTVKLGDKTLTYGVDYKLEYTNNTSAGKASFVVVGIAGGDTNYSGQTDPKTFTITVKKPTLDTISITAWPTKVTYTKGEALDPAGLVLTLSYSNGDTKTVAYGDTTKDQFSFSPETFNTAGFQTVTVTYGGKTAQFTVTVSEPAAPTVTGVAVKSGPTKTAYKVGESLDPKGLVLTLTMSDGSTQEAKYDDATADFAFDITQFNAAGEKTITVTYKGMHTATFTVTVTADEQPEPQPGTHTVTVVLGNGEANLTFQVKDGEKLAEPAAPKRDGYTFAGWFKNLDPATGGLSGSYDFSAPVKSDLTIYAGWLPVGGGQQPGQPTTPEQPGGSTTGGSGSGAGTASGDALAKTGDPTTVGVALATAVSGAVALAASRRRR